jgi:DNA-binding beta-propeller fold protein YncE
MKILSVERISNFFSGVMDMLFIRGLLFSILIFTLSALSLSAQKTSDQPLLLVLNKAGASLTILDADSMKVLGNVKVGDGPHEVVTSADGKTAFVANYGGQTPGSTLSVIDLKTMKEVRRADLSPLMRPHGIQEIGGKIYFSAETNRAIARYDPATDKVDWMMGTGQNASHMVVGSSDQKRFYTANIASDSVTMFALQNIPPAGSQITQIPVGKQPEAIDLSPDGNEVWVGLNAEGAVDVISTTGKKVVEKVNLGGRPYRVRFTPNGKQVFSTLPNTKEIVISDAATRREIKRMKLDNSPLGIIFSKDGKTAFVTTIQADGVIRIDTEKFEVTGTATAGAGPDGVALAGM